MTSVISRIMIAPVLFSTLLGASDSAKATTDRSEKPTQILAKHLYANTRNHTVLHDKYGFSVKDGDQVRRVQDVDLSADLKGVNKDGLKKLFAKGKALQATRVGQDWSLKTTERIKGGGPISGWIAYWTAKSLGYGCLAGAATAAATTLVVAAPAAVGAVATTASGLALGAAMPATAATGATLIGAAVATNAAAVSGTVVVAAELATTAAAAGGVVGAIETTSAGIRLFFAGIPFLP